MRRSSITTSVLAGGGTLVSLLALTACGATAPPGDLFGGPDGGGTTTKDASGGTTINSDSGTIVVKPGDAGKPTTGGGGDGGVACPKGYDCSPTCGSSTVITGKIYDPAGANPLPNIMVFAAAQTPDALPRGVPGYGSNGGTACSCESLYTGGALAYNVTGVDGTFTLTTDPSQSQNVPAGSAIQIVAQAGKWRTHTTVNVNPCTTNNIGQINMPTKANPSDPVINIPDIAVSTGGADSLECLMIRVGLDSSEYVSGASTSGHVHVYSGGQSSGFGGKGGNYSSFPASYQYLWDSVDHLAANDVTLLSCEGSETYNPNAANLESYLNAGGRAFGSHFHYAWFSGPKPSNSTNGSVPDWNNLATWNAEGSQGQGPDPGTIVQTLNVGGGAFAKGQELDQWLSQVGALGVNVTSGDLSIYSPRYNAVVSSSNTASQPWISDSSGGNHTMYFSFDTPVPTAAAPTPQVCGRAVFSDLHVSGDPTNQDNKNSSPPPASCSPGAGHLSPQEKALEFMLFDLSSCITPVTGTTNPPPPPSVPPQ